MVVNSDLIKALQHWADKRPGKRHVNISILGTSVTFHAYDDYWGVGRAVGEDQIEELISDKLDFSFELRERICQLEAKLRQGQLQPEEGPTYEELKARAKEKGEKQVEDYAFGNQGVQILSEDVAPVVSETPEGQEH